MILIADNKRRVLLPKTAQPGDVFECVQQGERFVLDRLRKPPKGRPPVSKKRLKLRLPERLDLDEPAFPPLKDEGID